MEMPSVVAASRLADRPAAAMVRSGIEALDALTGGLPRGGLTEICGPASSGRTSVLLAVMAKMTAQGEVCALVDASDSFDPKSAFSAGVDLNRLLWVRCSPRRHGGTEKSIADCRLSIADCGRSGQWPVASGERKATASMADGPLDCARGRLWPMAETGSSAAMGHRRSTMDSLEQALKATDLLLQGGGFGLVVVDLGDVPAPAARRVPLTSWFRFRRAVENTRTVLMVVEQEPYAKTCASVVCKLSAISSQLSARLQASGSRLQEMQQPAHARILSGLEISAEMVRSAAQGKKPVRSAGARWESRTAWAG
ncbi:MAG: DNA recombination/repair protein RecA [Acidobacteriia bacterium]|nr:DNA recombination/repair protein RecA [Terriglobia bacterium]